MKIPVFFSYPKPYLKSQDEFRKRIERCLKDRGLEPRTLGVTDYDTDAPLRAIRRLMRESNGLITVAFRRTLVAQGTVRPETDLSEEDAELPATPSQPLKNAWFTSPWPHIEAAMAYQLGLPILIFREKGVVADGVLEKGIVGLYMPEFDVDKADAYFGSLEWSEIIGKWEGWVRAVVERKGNPPRLY